MVLKKIRERLKAKQALEREKIQIEAEPHMRMGSGKTLLDYDYLERWWQNKLSQSTRLYNVDNQFYSRIRRLAE